MLKTNNRDILYSLINTQLNYALIIFFKICIHPFEANITNFVFKTIIVQ